MNENKNKNKKKKKQTQMNEDRNPNKSIICCLLFSQLFGIKYGFVFFFASY